MATRLLYRMDYQSDIPRGGTNGTGLYERYPVDIAQGFEDCVPAGLELRGNDACQCLPRGLFSPRAVVGRFPVTVGGVEKCVEARIPVPTPAGIAGAVVAMKACGAICVNVVGESWSRVPPTLVPYTPDTQAVYQVPATRTALIKVSGVMVYASDALGNLSAGVRYTAEPLDLTGATINDGVATAGAEFQACHGILADPIPCAENPGVTTRRVTIIAQQQAGADAPIRRLSKEVPLSNLNNLVACMTAIGQLGVCLAYNGESIDYADVLLGV